MNMHPDQPRVAANVMAIAGNRAREYDALAGLGCASHPIPPVASQLSSLLKTDLAIRRVAEQSGTESLVVNMSRQIFGGQYISTTIDSGDEFIQLSFLRGKPNLQTIARL